MRAVPATWEKNPDPMCWRCADIAAMGVLTRYGNPNRNAAAQQGTGQAHRRGPPGCAAVSVLAGQVDIAAIDGMFLRSPAPGQQAGEAGRAVAAPRGGHRAGPAHCAANPGWAGGWIREGPGHPVDNGVRSRCRRDALRSEGIPRPSSQPGPPRTRGGHPRAGKVLGCRAEWQLRRRGAGGRVRIEMLMAGAGRDPERHESRARW